MTEYVEKQHDKHIAELYVTHKLPAREITKEVPLSQSCIEHRIASMRKAGIIPRGKLPPRYVGNKGGIGRPAAPPPLYLQCAAHWRDLDREHPRGWPSLRIPEGIQTRMEAYVSPHMSMIGTQLECLDV